MSEVSYIKLEKITKVFGSVVANDEVNFDVRKGEILALLGENGSGKSTVVNMLSGIYSPDSGTILMNGKPTIFASPKESIKSGIGMVHQHFKLVEILSAGENIAIGQKSGFFNNKKKHNQKILELEKKYGLGIDPDKKVYDMSVSEKQNLEIMKVLYRGAELIILDEPTAVLTPQEIKSLFKILKRMKEKGCSIIIITHKLSEVMKISDRVTILRKGKSIATVNTAETTAKELTELMVGGAIDMDIKRVEAEKTPTPMLSIHNLTKMRKDGVEVLKDISFDLHGGEILGVAGIAGSGQKELCEIIAGLIKSDEGKIEFRGEDITDYTPRMIIKKGISMSFIPEDRLGMGLVAGMSITNNVLLKSFNYNPGPFLDFKYGKALAEDVVKKFDISTPSTNHIVKKLSGGNIQKVLLGREISLLPKLLVTAYPVRGLDIGASLNIYDILNQQKQKGVGVLFIGEDLDVLMSISDRIMVLNHGKIMDILEPHQYKKEDIGLLMMGQKLEEVVQ